MLEQIQKAWEQNIPIIITSKKNKTFWFQVKRIEHDKVIGVYQNGIEGSIFCRNILKCEYVYLSLKDYYLDILMKNKTEQTPDINLQIYETVFKQIQEGDLLYSYLNHTLPNFTIDKKAPFLLLTASNHSQKNAVIDALEKPITIIEGPPGTGKTTTILSLIANFVYRKQKVVVVSKNNSAIQNIKEEFDESDLPPFYIRVGKKEFVEKTVLPKLEQDLTSFLEKSRYHKIENEDTLRDILYKIDEIEQAIEEGIQIQNQLYELKNAYRHVLKKINAYAQTLPSYLLKNSKRIPSFLQIYAYSLLYTELSEKLKFHENLVLSFLYHASTQERKKWSILLSWDLELQKLKKEINKCDSKIAASNLEELQSKLKKLYEQDYNEISKTLLLNDLAEYVSTSCFTTHQHRLLEQLKLYQQAEDKKEQDRYRKFCMKEVLSLYPAVLTTVDAFLYNFQDALTNHEKIDVVIIDEASQCDIISALPLLALARQIVVVGDCKQLSAIIKLGEEEVGAIEYQDYNYFRETFLSSMKKVFQVKPHLLREHYRCDYNIINYCNKFFYDNELIIYTKANQDAMALLLTDQQKGAEKLEKGFQNLREKASIEAMIDDMNSTFVISPFKKQAELFEKEFGREHCGTIHTFQGKGAKTVFMSSVLSDLEECKNHLIGPYNMFVPELVNVAVSRAKQKFILACAPDIFKKHSKHMKNLIDYIETYGRVIPDKTVYLYDGLYKQIKAWKKHPLDQECDNIYEYELKQTLKKFLESYPHIQLHMHYPIANIVTDPIFLSQHPMTRQYLLNGANVDYCLYDTRLQNPVLLIEFDGKDHSKEEIQAKDQLKEEAIHHMGIPFWRLRSKELYTREELFKKLKVQLENSLL